MFSSFKVRNFRIYWFGMFVSLIGTWIQALAQSWLVFELTRSAFLLGVVGFLSSIPMLVFSFFGGMLADRINKRSILLVTQTAFMFLAFILAILTQFKLVTPSQIMVIAVLNGVVMAFDAPTRQAMVVELVGKKHLFNAIALNSAAFNSSRIIGPALAGLLVASIGTSGCFYINALSFLAVILALIFVKVDSQAQSFSVNTVAKDFKEGIIFIKNNRYILDAITLVSTVSLFGTSYAILMPIFANDVLKSGAKGLGVLMSSAGIGALIGALVLARLGDFRHKGRLLISASFMFSISLIMFSLSKAFLLSILALVFVGASSVTALSILNNLLQTRVPDLFRGRVMSVFMITFAGVMPFGNLLSGILSHWWGAPMAVLVSGVLCTILFVIITIFFKELREI